MVDMHWKQLSVAAALCLVLATQAQTQEEWQTARELNGVDLSKLSVLQKPVALAILRDSPCTCGCNMKMAECRVKDPACSYSKSLSAIVVKAVGEGKTPAQVQEVLAASKIAPPPPPPLLEDAVKLNIEGSPMKGPANAKVTIVEFSDFQCPYCSIAVIKANEVLKMYPNDVKLVFKHFPLSEMHPQAYLAAEASMAAEAQGKFWALHDKMFQNFRTLNRDKISALATESGLDMQRFNADMASGKYRAAVDRDRKEAEQLGLNATPTFFVNGRKFNANPEPQNLKPIIDAELKK
jgi:protein-disulfide isomerase